MNIRSAKGVMFKREDTAVDETRSIYHYLGIIRNRRWFLAAAVCTSLLIAFIASFVFTYEYRANATVQINPERSDFYEGWRQTGTVAEYRTYYLTELEGLTSNGLAHRVIEDLQLWDHKEFYPVWKRALGVEQSEAGVVEAFRERVRVSTLNESMLINVQFSASDPKLASTVLNALINRFTSEHNESLSHLPGLAADWMSDKIPALKTSLAEAEQKMDAYRRENGLFDVEGSINRLNELELSQTSLSATQMSLEIEQIRRALAEAMSIFEDMGDPAETGARLESLEMVSSDPVVQEAWMRRNTALNHKQSLSIKYGPKHPSMIDATTELASIDAEIANQIDLIITTAIKRVESLNRQLSVSQSQVADKKQDVMSTQENRYKLSALEREVALQRQLVDEFYVETIKARTLEGFELASSSVVDAAVVPLQPYRPQRAIVLMLVALSSSIFALLFVFVHEHVDDKIRSTRDVAARLRINLLGILPEFTSTGFAVKPGKSREPAYMYQNSEVVAAAVNNIRTSLITHRSKRVSNASVLLVTASQSGEGSTTAAIALAHSFARLERVLLIDCHLRQSALPENSAETDDGAGLESLIAGTTSLEDSVRRNALGGNFDLLICAPDAARLTAILASSQFSLLLDRLREQYDRIILDAAPLQRDSSSIVLGRLADAIVYVVRSHSTRQMTILRGIRRLRAADAFVAGVMINRIDLNRIVSRGGDYDYASYCGDTSCREKTDLDIAREALNAFTDRVRQTYRQFDAVSQWQKASTVVAHRARAMHSAIREVDMVGSGQRLVALKDSAKAMTESAVTRYRHWDFTGLREQAQQYRRTMISTLKYSASVTGILAREKLGALSGNTSKATAPLPANTAQPVKCIGFQSEQCQDQCEQLPAELIEDLTGDLSEEQELTHDYTQEILAYYLPKDFQMKADAPRTSDRPAESKKTVAHV